MRKNRLLLSVVSLLLVFCLMAGGTMAWFTDTEKVQGDFSAGVLDITLTPGEMTNVPLTFQNLRPMEYDDFKAEINDAGNGNQHTEGYGTLLPQYFQPVVIKNAGTLPVYLEVSTEALDMTKTECADGGEEKIALGETGNPGKVDWDKTGKDGTCANGLAEALKIVLFEKLNGVWTVVADNLNPATAGEPYEPGVVIPAATGEKTYVVGAYLPGETTGNVFQGKHFHGSLVVNAVQTDVGAGTPSTPEQPEFPKLTKKITVGWMDQNLNTLGSYEAEVVFPEGAETISFAPDKSKLPEGRMLFVDEGATISRETLKVSFVTIELPELTKEITVEWVDAEEDMKVIGSYQAQVTFPRGKKSISFTPDASTLPKGWALSAGASTTVYRDTEKVRFMPYKVVIIEPTDPLNQELKETVSIRWYTGPYEGMVENVIETKTIEVTYPAKQKFTILRLSNLEPPAGYRWADAPVLAVDSDLYPILRGTTQIDMRAEPV